MDPWNKKKDKLKSRIIHEQPGLEKAYSSGAELLTLNLIREWVYRTTRIANIKTQKELKLPVWQVHLNDVLLSTELYDRDIIGTTCGGTNKYLSQVYKLFGLDSTTYNFGSPKDSLTHVVSIVELKSRKAFMVQDANFNGYLELNDEVFNIFSIDLNTNLDEIVFIQGESKKKFRLVSSSDSNTSKEKKLVEFSWEDGIKWFKNRCLMNNLKFSSFFNLLNYPLSYSAMNIPEECQFLDHLFYLSNINSTTYKPWKTTPSSLIGNRATNIGFIENSVNFFLERLSEHSTKRVTIYGIEGIGFVLYKELQKLGINVIEILDGDNQKIGTKIDNITIEHYRNISRMNPTLVVICSFSHGEEMRDNIKSLVNKNTEIALIKEFYHNN